MFAFGSQTDDGFMLVQTPAGHVYTYHSKREARKSFPCVRSQAHLYRIHLNLLTAQLVEIGDNQLPAPETVETTEEQRLALYQSYPYKSLLCWAPLPE